jgi:hypothetical protein
MASARTLHVRCTTWDQVEVFHTRKLRRGKLLSMKVPFHSDPGSEVTLNLELPNQVVIVIEGTVLKSSPVEPDPKASKPEIGKTWLEVELAGFTEEVIGRIRRMAAGDGEPVPTRPVRITGEHATFDPASASSPRATGATGAASAGSSASAEGAVHAPRDATRGGVNGPALPVQGGREGPPSVDDLPADERALFQHLTSELRRLRSVAVHEVLGVARDADTEEIRRGWMDLVRRHHPDLVARRNAPAISHLAEELTILANRAYDRLRVALVAEGRATSVGPALSPPPGWLVGFDDISSTGSILRAKLAQSLQTEGNAPPVEPIAPAPSSQVQGGEAFEQRARAMLSEGDADNAQEVLAAALCVYPRSRPLRSLYYVASAISALGKGEVMLATSQLETALAHHEQCVEAAAILELLRRSSAPVANDEMKRLFR